MKSMMFAVASMAAMLVVGAARADDKVTLQLKWVTQAQFAGYYVAKDKGFYKEDGLDVTIKPGGPDVAPEQVLAGGGADVVVDWMPAALAAREKGAPMVNIAATPATANIILFIFALPPVAPGLPSPRLRTIVCGEKLKPLSHDRRRARTSRGARCRRPAHRTAIP